MRRSSLLQPVYPSKGCARSTFSVPARCEAELVRMLPQGAGHELYMIVQIYVELLGAPHDIFPVHGRREGLLLHLLADALGLHVLQALGTHQGAGHYKPRELVDGVECLGHEGVAGHVEIVSVPLDGVEYIVGISSLLQLPDTDHGMLIRRGMLLVVHVVQESGYAPFLLVLPKAEGVGPHGGLDGQHVLAQGITLGPGAHEFPGFFAIHSVSLRSTGYLTP